MQQCYDTFDAGDKVNERNAAGQGHRMVVYVADTAALKHLQQQLTSWDQHRTNVLT
jgi:hypothetical protein